MNVCWGYTLIPGRLWATEETINHLHLDCVLTYNLDIWPCDSDTGREKRGLRDRSLLLKPFVYTCVCAGADMHTRLRRSGVRNHVYRPSFPISVIKDCRISCISSTIAYFLLVGVKTLRTICG